MTKLVYGQYDQAALDAQYEQRTLVPDISNYLQTWREDSARVRAQFDSNAELSYGTGERERIDLFPVSGTNSPAVLFLHGGAWRRLSKEEFLFPAPVFLKCGIAFAAAGFDLVPGVALAKQVDQARQALAWLVRNATQYGIDADKLFVVGNSSGAHLAGMLMAADADGEPSPARGALLVSGIYNLEPVRLSSRNEYLALDEQTAQKLSPIQHIPTDCQPLVVAWGGRELKEFQRQSNAFATTWEAHGGSVRTVILAEHNHFDMASEIGVPDSPLIKPFIDMVHSIA